MNGRSNSHRNTDLLACFSLIGAMLLAGCSLTGEGRKPPRRVDLTAFNLASEEAIGDTVDLPEGSVAPDQTPAVPVSPQTGEQDIPRTPVEIEQPRRAMARRLAPGDRTIVDSMVGQVNGRPIFADSFFEPIEDELIAQRANRTPREFAQQAMLIVGRELQAVVLNSLFLAEAEAALTPEQRQGIFAWLSQLEERVKAQHGGTRVGAQKKLRDEDDETVEEHITSIRDQELIYGLIRSKIGPRVIVSWRDIEREYQRRYDEFNPTATVVLARIKLSTEGQAEQIAQVTQQLAQGEQFVPIAEAINPAFGVFATGTLDEDDRIMVAFANETIQQKVGELDTQGDTVGPFQLDSSTWWLHVTEIDQPPRRRLYDPDVQRELNAYIRSVRFDEERDHYISSLMEEGIYDELRLMEGRLLTIAVSRYGP